MNSLIHFSPSPVSVAQEGLSSASRVHVSLLNHGSLSVSQWCKRSQLVSRPLYGKCTLERSSEGPKMKEENRKKKMTNNIMGGVGKASLVTGCVLGALTLSGKMSLKPNIAYAAGDQHQIPSTENGSFAPGLPSNSEIKAVKLWATVLSMKENCGDVAEQIISEECGRLKRTPVSNRLQFVLIELLLNQGKYPEAKEKIKELLAHMEEEPKAKDYLGKAIAELSEPDDNEIEALKLYAMALSKGDPEGAQEILRKEHTHWKGWAADEKLLMALNELLVYQLAQGKYPEAKKKIKELLKDIEKCEEDQNAKSYLRKAIAELERAKESKSKATDAWKEFLEKLSFPFGSN